MNSSICAIARPVLFRQVSVEMRDAQQILRARIAPPGCGSDIGHGRFAPTVLEQQQAVIVRCLDVPLRGGGGIKRLCLLLVSLHAAPQAIGLAEIELCIGIARLCRARPFAHRRGVIASRPGIDAALHISLCGRAEREQAGGQHTAAHAAIKG
jgi:hypothetical protein